MHRRERCSANLLELADELRWRAVAAPVVELCQSPRHAPDRTDGSPPPLPGERELREGYTSTIEQQRQELDEQRRELDEKLRELDDLHGELSRLEEEREGLQRLGSSRRPKTKRW